jgi:hypothetical protein
MGEYKLDLYVGSDIKEEYVEIFAPALIWPYKPHDRNVRFCEKYAAGALGFASTNTPARPASRNNLSHILALSTI